MPSQGPSLPGNAGSFLSAGTGEDNNDWTNQSNITADDGTEAQITAASYDTGDSSYVLYARNFGFSVPSDATIDGITVTIERRAFAGGAIDNDVRLTTGTTSGDRIGSTKASGFAWPGTSSNAQYGGAADLWGATLTPADVNDAFFGVAISVLATANNTDIGVDKILVEVNYTEASSDVTGTAAVSFPFSTASSGTSIEDVAGTGDLSFPFSTASSGAQTLEGSGGTTFPFSTALTGAETFEGTGGTTFPFSLASAGELGLSGAGDLSFPFSISASANHAEDDSVSATGDLAFSFATASVAEETLAGTGALAFVFAPAATAEETLSASGGLAFGFSAAAAADETLEGAADLSFVFSVSASGDVEAPSTPVGVGALSFGFNTSGAGEESLVGSGSPELDFSVSGVGATYLPISGVAAVSFSMSVDVLVNLPITEVAGDVLFLLRDKGRPRYPWSRSGFPRR